ncbi:MAG TPA: class I SAM-dependent methyltransferase [Chitinophagaceae bacterium]|nr:class I SAM-dependent methyltransferase [Chitinophagaceae bacterium]
MNKSYWEKIAASYDEEIFDVLQQDRKGIIRKEIKKQAKQYRSVIDIGCAVGKWLPLLAGLFPKVTAVDISDNNLSLARENNSGYPHIQYIQADMTSPAINLPVHDVAICINAILIASAGKQEHFIKNMADTLCPGGALILTVPSLESWMLTRSVQQRWQIDKSLFSETTEDKEAALRYQELQKGHAEIDNVLTKHFLGEELDILLPRYGLQVIKRKKIEYAWDTEFKKPPVWLQQPGPWDWMVLAQKNIS